MGEFDDLIQDFLIESSEHIEQLESDLVELEKNPKNKVALVCIFRSIHTLKGNCGFLGFPRLEKLTHAAESLLSLLRDEVIELHESMMTALLQTVDLAREILANLEKDGKEGDCDPTELIATFERLQNQRDISSGTTKIPSIDGQELTAPAPDSQKKRSGTDTAEMEAFPEDIGLEKPGDDPQPRPSLLGQSTPNLIETETESFPRLPESIDPGKSLPRNMPFPNLGGSQSLLGAGDSDHLSSKDVLEDLEKLENDPAISEGPRSSQKDSRETSFLGTGKDLLDAIANPTHDEMPALPNPNQMITSGVHNYSDLIASLRTAKLAASNSESLLQSAEDFGNTPPPKSSGIPADSGNMLEETPTPASLSENTVRIDLALLDQMMNLIGELVLTRNQILQVAGTHKIPALTSTCQKLNMITGQLQERVMKTRMQPIDRLFSKFSRLVRNVSRLCKKIVLLELQGGDTELDRSLVEAIRDPLTHVVRNAIDHGLESPEERLKAGKPREGRLLIKAYHEGGQVHIQVRDDGGGINPQKIRQRLVERQLLSAEETARLDDAQVVSLIFMPGFSTTETVTTISGRGVGMDVVKANIESLGGKIQVQTVLGAWTSFTITVPLTLAILPALIISSHGRRFAIPQANVQELIKLGGGHSLHIEEISGSRVFRLRNKLLPLIDLGSQLENRPIYNNDEDDHASLVVLKSNDLQFGLIIDAIHDSQEIVVKALDSLLKNIPIYSAATILDDGEVALILDITGLAQIAGLRETFQNQDSESAEALSIDITPMLVFGVGTHWRMAVPLETVLRLEEIGRDRLEMLHKQSVIQHNGQLIPVIFLNEFFNLEPDVGEDIDQNVLQLIVCSWRGRHVGLIVDRVIDIAEEEFQEQRHERKKGVFGTAILNGHATDLLDVKEVIQLTNVLLLDNPEGDE